MESNPSEVRLRNAESSLLFMQSQHAETLKGLHQEIHRLQKKCSELTFQLAMGTTSSVQEEELQNKVKVLEDQLTRSHKELDAAQTRVSEQSGALLVLQQEMNMFSAQTRQKEKSHSQEIHALNAEIETQANEIVMLQSQLRELRLLSLRVPAPPGEPRLGQESVHSVRSRHVRRSTTVNPDPSPFLPVSVGQETSVRLRGPVHPLPPIAGHSEDNQ